MKQEEKYGGECGISCSCITTVSEYKDGSPAASCQRHKDGKLKMGEEVNFLDYHIKMTGDGLVLYKNGDLYECHLGNYSSVNQAKKAAIILFMIARPSEFHAQILNKVMRGNSSGCMSEWYKFKKVVEKEGLKMPEEITPIGSINFLIGFKNQVISW